MVSDRPKTVKNWFGSILFVGLLKFQEHIEIFNRAGGQKLPISPIPP